MEDLNTFNVYTIHPTLLKFIDELVNRDIITIKRGWKGKVYNASELSSEVYTMKYSFAISSSEAYNTEVFIKIIYHTDHKTYQFGFVDNEGVEKYYTISSFTKNGMFWDMYLMSILNQKVIKFKGGLLFEDTESVA